MDEIIVWNVDTQKDFMYKDGGLSVPDAESIIPNLKQIFDEAKASNIRVISSADVHYENSSELLRNGGPFPDHCMAGTYGQANIPETLFEESDVGIIHWDRKYSPAMLFHLLSKPQVIVTKDDNDVFKESASPHIGTVMDSIAPGSIIYVTGVATEYCVARAIFGLAAWAKKNNATIVVVEDAIKPIDMAGHSVAMEKFKALGVRLATTSELLAAMRKSNNAKSQQVDAKFNVAPAEKKLKWNMY